ncbi:MAG: B12-binding domain-containing radical SAM protein [Deltaproteobacteria bacterium]|nr:B12-binding domain-containing radical SAM protein [Deltaproteobacteria bacterium]
MNITLIQPFTGGTDVEPPHSLACIFAALDKAGHRCTLIDLQQCKVRERWEEIFKNTPVDLVGLTGMTPQVQDAHEIAARVKASRPDVRIILGGVHATLLPEQTLKEFPFFDILVIGEGEDTVVELSSRLEDRLPYDDVAGIAYRKDGSIVITPPRPRITNLDSLPDHHAYYDFDFYLKNNSFETSDKAISLIVSRGCPYNCQFCATRNFWTLKYNNKSVDKALGEIRGVMRRGAEYIKFRDSTFVINKKWVREFCERIIKEKLRFRWAANARVDLVDYDLFKLMKKAGLDTICFGVESGSQRMLDFYGKGVTIEQIEKAFAVCKRLRLRTGAYYMLGALTETREEMDATFRLAKRLNAAWSWCFLFMPLPGSELYQYYIDQGCTFDYSRIRSDKAAFSSAGYSIAELEEKRAGWYQELNKRPNRLSSGINALLDVRSIYDLRRVTRKVRRFCGRMLRRLPV